MKKSFFAAVIFALGLVSCKNAHGDLKDGLYAEIETSKGNILLELEYTKAPVTVANFITLAEGKNRFVEERYRDKPFYDGLKFHRVIANFMIQGGDPLGTGEGGTGYKFKDEFTDLKHDKPGVLSMANSGPNTNSSQFFITHVATPWLNGKHSIFGYVVTGQDIVNKIVQNDEIKSVKIVRVGESAKKFDAVKVFEDYFAQESAKKKNKLAEFAQLRQKAEKLESGVEFCLVKKGSDEKPKPGQVVAMNYYGFLENGTLFDTNEASVAKEFGSYIEEREKQGGYAPAQFQYGQQMIKGFTEGLSKMNFGDRAFLYIPSNLGYGPQGMGNVIPPDSNLMFEVELVKAPAAAGAK